MNVTNFAKGCNIDHLTGQFFCEIKFLCIVVTMSDLVHDVEIIFHLYSLEIFSEI